MDLLLFFEQLRQRNEPLFYFGLACFLFAALCLLAMNVSTVQVLGVSGWLKPFKFAMSIGIFVWTMGWIADYLNEPLHIRYYSWCIIVLFAYELIYIGVQGARGQLSHYNISTPLFSFFYFLMAFAAAAITLWTLVIAIRFFTQPLPGLPVYYVWALRCGLLIFVIFSFEGFLMGSRMAHTIGAQDGSPGIPFFNWSKRFGDARVAHFIGMHALQVLPLLSWYLLKNTKAVLAVALLYLLLAVVTLVQALQGKPLIR